MKTTPYHIRNVRAIRQTAKALHVSTDSEEFWIPLSQIRFDSEVKRPGDVGTLTTTSWWAQQAGLNANQYTPPELPDSLPKAKRLYLKLIFDNHPDRGGDPATAAAINMLWQAVLAEITDNTN